MSFFKRAKEVAGDLGAAGKRQAQRGKLEVEVRRLEGKISSEKDAIGQALYPLLERGELQVDLPEVHEHLKAIADLQGELGVKRAEIEALKEGGDDGDDGDGGAGEPAVTHDAPTPAGEGAGSGQ